MREKQQLAIYLRLSTEDAFRKEEEGSFPDESNSISNQRKLIRDYISRDAELAGYGLTEFCDDGYSGTNMERPGIQKLLKEVRLEKIKCIIVKDMSRFSRDYIETGTYLNQIFPFMGVRFIAINDRYDSREHEGSTIEIDAAFRTLLYDLYSKDISIKVKTSIGNKCANGEYVFGQVPFGYEKSRRDRNEVIINESEAEIVRYIFSLAQSGMTSTQIAKRLSEEQIPTAAQMRFPKQSEEMKYRTWSGTAVRNILNNRFYLGEMAYGKTVCKSVGSKNKVKLPENVWKVISDHHEPLITPQIYEQVSAFRPKRFGERKRTGHPFTGKLYCGGCGFSMNYKTGAAQKHAGYFWCRKHALLQIPDCCTYFNAAILEEILRTELYWELVRRGDWSGQQEELQKAQKENSKRLLRKAESYKKQYHELQSKKDSLYEDYAVKQIKAEEYRSRADAIALQMQELSGKIEEAEQAYERIGKEYVSSSQNLKQMLAFLKREELTREAADIFLKKVTVYKDKRVEIEWNFKG